MGGKLQVAQVCHWAGGWQGWCSSNPWGFAALHAPSCLALLLTSGASGFNVNGADG